MDKPFFFAKLDNNGKIETKGIDQCFLGHKIPRGNEDNSDGVFVEWSWDGETLVVKNDRYGFYPLYYYCIDNEMCISPSLTRLLDEGAPRALDYTALSVFLRIDFFIGEDTPFKSIRMLPPNATFQWRKGKLSVTGEYCSSYKRSTLSYDEAMDKYIELFRKSIKRHLPINEPYAVPITGGRDSRHILFELDHLGSKPDFCLTIRKFPPEQDDVRVGRLIADRLHIKHVALDHPESFFNNEIRRNVETNFCSDELRESSAVTDYLLGKVNVYFDGMVGDVLSTSICCNLAKTELFEQRRFDDLAKRMFSERERACFPEETIKGVFSKELYEQMSLEKAVAHLVKELKKHADTPNPSAQFYFWNRTRREIALSAYAISSSIPTIYSPYLDRDLYDFLSTLDARTYLIGHDFHSETIARAYPQYADIEYENKSMITDSGSLQKQYVRKLLFYLIKEHTTVRKIFNVNYVAPRLVKYSVSNTETWMRPHWLHYFVELGKRAKLER